MSPCLIRPPSCVSCRVCIASNDFAPDFDCSGRKLNELNLPSCRAHSFNTLRKRFPASTVASAENARHVASTRAVENGVPAHLVENTNGLQQPSARPEAATAGARQAEPTDDAPLSQTTTQQLATRNEHGRESLTKEALKPPADVAVPGVASVQPVGGKLVNGTTPGSGGSDTAPAAIVLIPPEHAGAASASTSAGDEAPSFAEGSVLTQLNGTPCGPKTADPVHETRAPPTDPSRYPDALSSPGSTAQSTLTTTVHDGSADTSPDHEEPQYAGRSQEDTQERSEGDKSVDDGRRRNARSLGLSGPSPEPGSSIRATVSGVEAQLLEESAAAQLSRTKTPRELPTQPRPDDNSQPAVCSGKALTNMPEADAHDEDVDMIGVGPDTQPGRSIAPTSTMHEPETETRGEQSRVFTQPMDVDEGGAAAIPRESQSEQVDDSHLTKSPLLARDAQVSAAPVSQAETSTSSVPKEPEPTKVESLVPPSKDVQAITEGREPPPPEKEVEATSQTLSAGHLKLLANKGQNRRRSVPTVIFGRPAKNSRTTDDSSLTVSRQQPGHIPSDDYFTPLFIEGFTRQSTWMKPIEKLLNQAHKTLSTPDQYVSILDHQACKLLRRVYHLQQHDKWSLRQPVRCPEPTRPPSHWDVLLQEMKWMRTDFREERKWKRAVARNLASACAEWVNSSPVERLALQVNAVIPPAPETETAKATAPEPNGTADDSLPELVHSDSPTGDSAEHDEEPMEVSIETIAPATIFALQDDEVVFNLQPSKTADELLANLPMYGSPLRVPKFDFVGPEYDPDARWRRPALPLSKYVEGEMVLDVHPPPRKRSRFQYQQDSKGGDGDEVIFGARPDDGVRTQPDTTDVALFNPEMRSTRERLHASHQFRPPTEHIMPSQSFYECRIASQWTWSEDDQLKSLVREYSYNWSLISTIVSTPSLFASAAERRTPWECFERWVQLEGLPNDFGKSPYFKAYQGRIDAAQKVIMEQNQKAQQQVGPNGAVTPVPRKRPTTTVRVERRRNQKHLALIDAMRKLAKKREGSAQKAAQAANLASMRKANEAQAGVRPQVPIKTPRDYSLIRWERDQQIADRMAQYTRRNNELQKRVSISPASRERHLG